MWHDGLPKSLKVLYNPLYGVASTKVSERSAMKDHDKTKDQLIAELEELRGRVSVLEASETEWRRTEEALQQSEERFRLLVEAIPQPIWRSDADGNVIEFNRRWHEYTGQTAEEAKGSGWAKALHSDEAAMVVNKVRAGITSGVAIEIVNRLRRASDGSYRWHLARAVPMNDRGGKTIGWFGCVTDIDDQKQAEEALKKAHDELEQKVEERTVELTKANEELAIFRKFAETSGQGFSMADLDGHLLYLNPALCRMLGEERQEGWVGQHLSICYSEESNRRGKDEIEPALMRVGYWQGELPMLSRQGKSIPTWHNAFLIRDESGNPLRLAVVITDIAERKAAEEALRASEERFRVTFEEAPVGMVIGVGDGIIAKANRAVCRMTGFSQEELIQRHVRDLTHPEDRGLSGPFVKRLFAGEIPSFTVEKRYLRKGGQSFWAQATTAAIQGPDGKIAFGLGVVEDIDDRKRAEEALKQERRTLKHMLEASDHERRLISYDIHDGLAQELAGAIMQFQIYAHARQANPKDAAKAFDSAMTMLQQSHAEARRLISGVRPPILDESGVVAAIVHLVYDPAFEQGPKIEFRNRVKFERLAPVLENVIYRIVQEGLTNARSHSKSKEIMVGLKQRGDRLQIEIRDWGVGFDPKTVRENRFGLEGIRERARLLGGKCRIHSKPGEGTSIVVELPVAEQESEPQ